MESLDLNGSPCRHRSQPPLFDGGLARRRDNRRPDRVQAARYRSLSRSDAADGRHRYAKSGIVVGRDRALHHDSDRDPGFRHQEPTHDAHHLAVWIVRLQPAFSFHLYQCRALQQVLNRLSQLPPLLGNVQPTISPLSAIGELYRYRLAGPPNYSVLELTTLLA